MSRSEYDRGVNTFSPEGRLFQVEYAIEAIKVRRIQSLSICVMWLISFLSVHTHHRTIVASNSFKQLGSTAIGIQASDGLVLGVEKRISSPLMIPTVTEKIVEIDSHVGCACSGLVADSRTLIDRARVEAQVCDYYVITVGCLLFWSTNFVSPLKSQPESLVFVRWKNACWKRHTGGLESGDPVRRFGRRECDESTVRCGHAVRWRRFERSAAVLHGSIGHLYQMRCESDRFGLWGCITGTEGVLL